MLGLIYAWSLFIDPLEAEFGWTRTETSFVFTLSLISFSLGMLAEGAVDKKFSPHVTTALTTVFILIGFIGAAFTTELYQIYITYGIFVGFASGFGTDAVMGATLQWFPDKQGFMSGALLMGFGMGALILSPFVTMLLASLGWRNTFLIIGLVFGALILVAAIIMRNPPEEFSSAMLQTAREKNIVSAHDFSALEMIKTSSFWTFIIWLILVSSGGLALISQAVPAAEDVLAGMNMEPAAAALLATAAMGSISFCNGLGRLINGFVWDRFGFRASLLWISVAFIASMALNAYATMTSNFPLIVAGFVLLGLAYGGNMSSMAAMCGGFFGTKFFTINYAVATCQMLISATIGPMLSASLQESTGNYLLTFWVFLGIAVVALIVSFFIHKPKQAENR